MRKPIKHLLSLALLLAMLTQQTHAGLLPLPKKGTILGAGVLAGAAWVSYCKAHPRATHAEDEFGNPKPLKVPCMPPKDPSGVEAPPPVMDKSSDTRELRKNLKLQDIAGGGTGEPPEGCAAHHIVPKDDGRKGLKDLAGKARTAISGCVGIDSAENGVFLPNKKEGSQCDGSYHRTLHDDKYYRNISERLRVAKTSNGCSGVRATLREIKSELIGGMH